MTDATYNSPALPNVPGGPLSTEKPSADWVHPGPYRSHSIMEIVSSIKWEPDWAKPLKDVSENVKELYSRVLQLDLRASKLEHCELAVAALNLERRMTYLENMSRPYSPIHHMLGKNSSVVVSQSGVIEEKSCSFCGVPECKRAQVIINPRDSQSANTSPATSGVGV